MDIDDVMNYIIDNAAPQLDPHAIAGVFDALAYCLDESVLSRLEAVSMDWLRGRDEAKAAIALARTDAFPASTRHELLELIEDVVEKFPRLEVDARNVVQRWDSVFGDMA